MIKTVLAYLRLFLVVGILVSILPLSLVSAATPVPGQPMIVIAPPWGGGAAGVSERAGAVEVAPARAPLAVLAVASQPDRLRAEGAWLVLDAAAVAAFCSALIKGT